MKKHLLVSLAAIILYSSCCHTMRDVCQTKGNAVGIRFFGFDKEDLDTVYTTGYEPGTGFTKTTHPTLPYTSIKAYPTSPAGAFMGCQLPANYEWKIYIPTLNRTISIGNYTYETHKCQNCMDKYKLTELTTCLVNDTLQQAYDIKIYK